MSIVDAALYLLAIGMGFALGYWFSRMTEESRWKPYIISAYNRGRTAGYEKAVKEGKCK
jgi:hypothetical protein